MSDLNVVEIPDKYPGKHRIVTLLETLLEQAKNGEITGIVFVTEEQSVFGWGKCNVTHPTALGMLARCAHHVNKEWDAAALAHPPKAQ